MAFYVGPVPRVSNPETQQVLDIIWERLQRLESELSFFSIEESFVEPDNPIDGMVVFADGTSWNPGSGRGLYRFDGSSWESV
jgi:hypothetical protein